MNRFHRITLLLAGVAAAFGSASAIGQSFDEPESTQQDVAPHDGERAEVDRAPPAADDESLWKPTDLGLRFTPEMARAIAGRMAEQMTPRYELSSEQSDRIADVMARQLMKLAHDSQQSGRDAIELLMATTIEHDGMLPPEQAIEFAEKLRPVIPRLEKFFNDSAKQIAAQMPFRQRLKFTGDFAAVTAGFNLFKGRMESWQRGEVDRMVNPFFDPPGASSRPAGERPAASPQLDRAEQRAERRIAMYREELKRDWDRYVEMAIEYYGLDERQVASAKSILDETRQRAGSVQTESWERDVRDNRIRQYLCYELGPRFSGGPLAFQLEQEYERLMRPVEDLTSEFKRRIDALPTSEQRALARRTADDKYAELGAGRP